MQALKKNLLVLVLVWYLPTLALAQKKEDIAAIKAELSRQEAAWNKGDIPGFMQGYWNAEDLMFISKSGVVYGWQATLARYQKSYPDKQAMGTLSFEVVKIDQLSTKSVWLVGKWKLTRTDGELGGHFSLLWKKLKGQWKIVADHTS